MKVTDKVSDPTARIIPAAGEYTNVPGIVEVASSCVALSGVPEVIAEGAAQVMEGVVLPAVNVKLKICDVPFAVAVSVAVCDVATADTVAEKPALLAP